MPPTATVFGFVDGRSQSGNGATKQMTRNEVSQNDLNLAPLFPPSWEENGGGGKGGSFNADRK